MFSHPREKLEVAHRGQSERLKTDGEERKNSFYFKAIRLVYRAEGSQVEIDFFWPLKTISTFSGFVSRRDSF